MKRPTKQEASGLRQLAELVKLATIHPPRPEVAAAVAWIERLPK